METIYALASARGRAGVSVIRISGSDAFDAVRRLGVERLPPVRQAGLRRLTYAGDVLDDALVLLFAKGASFTGEETAELHVHGSTATVAAVLSALGACGLRLAEPGEFTRRALENGCLDLTQVEGLADLIDAETESQRKQALRVLSGAIGQRAESWRRALIRAAALIEATIDFADEDVPVDVSPEVEALLQDVLSDLRNEVGGSVAAERIREGFEVAIVGAPNAGKSTLLNYLAGREAAITSDIAGTTRDVIEVRMDVQGLAVTFLDTAGLRDTDDRIEAMGIARAMERAKAADLRIFLDDGTPRLLDPQPDDVIVRSKADISGVGVSGVTGAGVKELIANVSDVLSRRSGSAGTITRARHREAIEAAIKSLEDARNLLHGGFGDELVAESLRFAIRCLDALVGRVDVEDLLSEIFASFCIGK